MLNQTIFFIQKIAGKLIPDPRKDIFHMLRQSHFRLSRGNKMPVNFPILHGKIKMGGGNAQIDPLDIAEKDFTVAWFLGLIKMTAAID